MEYIVFFGLLFMVVVVGVCDVLARRSPVWLEHACELARNGNDREAMRWIARIRWVGTSASRFGAEFLRMSLLADRGDTEKAIHIARSCLQSLASPRLEACPWQVLNTIVVTLINGGRYSEAISASQGWTEDQRIRGRDEDPDHYVLVRINEAEALCNLAQIDEALARLEEVREAAGMTPFALAGLTTLRAWILLQAGRNTEAREALAEADLSPLFALYSAEVEYTRAALERDSGDLEAARQHAKRGLAAAKRASSCRNGLFMVAGVAALRGEHDEARRLFERGARSHYRAQAGEGLTRYAQFLDILGESEKAKRVRGWITKRDPEWRDPRSVAGRSA